MIETLLDKVGGIQLKGGLIEGSDFSAYQAKAEAFASDCCYGADCGDCDCGGYCIDSECS